MRVPVAITVAVLLTCAVAPELEAGRAGRQATWRGAAAAKLGRLRRAPQAIRGSLGRARASVRVKAGRAGDRVRRTARRQVDRVSRAGVFIGMAVTWLGATKVEPQHQMKAVLAGIVLAAASASITWVRLIRGHRREQQAFYDRFQAEFDEFEQAFQQARADAGRGRAGPDPGYRPPPRRAVPRPIPRPPAGQTWPPDLVAVLDEMASAQDKGELSRIYRAAARRYHPDHGGDLEHSKTLNAFYSERQQDLPK